jgi:hypothetical protein
MTYPYPTRHVSLQTQDEANLDTQLPPSEDIPHIQQWANTIIDPDTGALMEYRHLIKRPKYCQAWQHSFANELGRLAQGVGGREKGTNTIYFKPYDDIPIERRRDVTYGRICVDHRPQKMEPNCTRRTVERVHPNVTYYSHVSVTFRVENIFD